MKDLELLWELTGEQRAGFPSDWNNYFEPVGLILHKNPERWTEGGSPRQAVTFASTGGDSVHYSFLQLPGRAPDHCPIVMTLPCAEGANFILGENLRDFLGLGCRNGYFSLEQLEDSPEELIPFLDSQAYDAEADESEIALLKQIELSFQLQPPVNVAQRLARLKAQYGHLLV